MTIKRRLFISNILMIVIPVAISIIISVAGMTVVWKVYFQESRFHIENQREFNEVRNHIMDSTRHLLEGGNETVQKESISKLEVALKQNKMTLSVFVSGEELYSIGGSEGQAKKELLDAVRAIGGDGTVRVGNEEVFAENVRAKEKTYTVCLFSTAEIVSDTGDNFPAAIPIAVIVCTLIVVFLTNRFLTQFVFRKVEEPLNILATGVHQIRDGNLDYQITYENKDEFASICEDFNEMAVRLRKSVTLIQKQEHNRKELLAGISHDLRSPLTSIKAYSEGLLDGVAKTSESQTAYLQMIKTKTEDIDRMVSKLFLFSKMDMGDYPHYPETLNLEEEIISFVQATAEEYASKGLNVQVEELANDVGIYADPVQLRSVFSNILENSLKYKDKEQGSVSIRSIRYGSEVHIYMEDNGPGVSEEALPKLFDVFYRTDPSRNNPNKGSGLGLAITAKAIGRMGGSIHAKNYAGNGLCMVIKLPILKKGERNA